MKALLHPVYFPNIVTMAALVSNTVVWEKQDNFQKQTYRNRCYICTDQGKHMLTLPIVHIRSNQGRQKYKEVKLDNSYNWQRQHWRTLQTAYRTSPFFEFYEDDLAPLFEKPTKYLFDLNLSSIDFICTSLGIAIPDEKTTSYQTQTENLEDLRHLANAKKQIDFKQEAYNQVFSDRHSFLKNTSTLDLLFNEGPNALSYLKKHTSL